MLAFYESLPRTDYAGLTRQVVERGNPRDPYLRLGAAQAIQEYQMSQNSGPLGITRTALNQFEVLQESVITPITAQFEQQRQIASIEGEKTGART